MVEDNSREEYQYDTFDGADLFTLAKHIGGVIEAVYGIKAANAAMYPLVGELASQAMHGTAPGEILGEIISEIGHTDWRKLWLNVLNGQSAADSADFDILESAQRCCVLHQFGTQGTLVDFDRMGLTHEIEDYVRRELDWATNLLAIVPPSWFVGLNDLSVTIAAATGRWKLDVTSEPLSPEELAALVGGAPKTIRNLMSNGTLVNLAGKIPTMVAARWLKDNPKFKPSTWRSAPVFEETSEPEFIKDPIFIPFNGQEQGFFPNVKTPGGYVLGEKGSEEKFEDYWEALARLQELKKPRWRRPSKGSGRPSIVIGQTYRPVARAEIEAMIATLCKGGK